MKIGLFFGSFNPIHVGHMMIANYMVEYTDMEQVWFVVSPQNPLKKKETLLPQRHRLQLVKLAIGDDLRFKASDVEFKLSQPSYTIHTLVYLQEQYPQHQFCLIIGADNLLSLPNWKNYDQLLANYELYVYPRPGVVASELFNHSRVHLTKSPTIEISATFIRDAIAKKKNVRHFLPSDVYQEIIDMHFYEK